MNLYLKPNKAFFKFNDTTDNQDASFLNEEQKEVLSPEDQEKRKQFKEQMEYSLRLGITGNCYSPSTI
jgi:hypothetical protein